MSQSAPINYYPLMTRILKLRHFNRNPNSEELLLMMMIEMMIDILMILNIKYNYEYKYNNTPSFLEETHSATT